MFSGQNPYICIYPDSIKTRNIAAYPRVSIALVHRENPYIVKARARLAAITVAITQIYWENMSTISPPRNPTTCHMRLL